MNAGMANEHESHFGPPSEVIDIAQFTKSTTVSPLISPSWDQISQDQQSAIEAECSVSDIKTSILDVLNDPRLYAHVSKSHQVTVSQIYDAADTSKKRKRKRPAFVDPAEQIPEVTDLQNKMDAIQLRSWPLMLDSALFMRAPKNSDQNALTEVKQKPLLTSSLLPPGTQEGLLTITVHSRLTWGHGYLSRISQHAVLASQTLGNLYDVIPCPAKECPKEKTRDGHIVGYELTCEPNDNGCVMCIEGMAYGDGQSQPDYADKLLVQINALPIEKRPSIKKAPTTMYQTYFASLSLRLHEPYWLLHQGNCEHFIVVDQIRLQHISDPISGYPLTLQVTPPLLDLCRGCTKVPAVWSIVGDIRLGESPYVLCAACWRNMGKPSEDEGVLVAPLPKHVLGW